MIKTILDGLATGMLLQLAIGPVFFYLLNLSLQRSTLDGLVAVAAVTLVDYLYITLAVAGVGKLLERERIKRVLGMVSAPVLLLFGAYMIFTSRGEIGSGPDALEVSNLGGSFASTFLLTISSPLTILFWTSLFAAKAVEKQYRRRQLILFGGAAGAATFLFLGFSVLILSSFRTLIPGGLIRFLNIGVGVVLIIYAIVRFIKTLRRDMVSSTGGGETGECNEG